MKIRDRPIEVELAEGSRYRPDLLLTDFGHLRVTARLDFWVVRTAWWNREVHRIYLVLATTGGVVEVYIEEGQWYLHRVQD